MARQMVRINQHLDAIFEGVRVSAERGTVLSLPAPVAKALLEQGRAESIAIDNPVHPVVELGKDEPAALHASPKKKKT